MARKTNVAEVARRTHPVGFMVAMDELSAGSCGEFWIGSFIL